MQLQEAAGQKGSGRRPIAGSRLVRHVTTGTNLNKGLLASEGATNELTGTYAVAWSMHLLAETCLIIDRKDLDIV